VSFLDDSVGLIVSRPEGVLLTDDGGTTRLDSTISVQSPTPILDHTNPVSELLEQVLVVLIFLRVRDKHELIVAK
jgi:hypothetical protein